MGKDIVARKINKGRGNGIGEKVKESIEAKARKFYSEI